jgi:hypothetical protein
MQIVSFPKDARVRPNYASRYAAVRFKKKRTGRTLCIGT